MSEPTAPDPTGTEPAGDSADTEQDTGRAGQNLTREALEAELSRARRDAAKYREKARDNQQAADKFTEIENTRKSEIEKLTEHREQLLTRATSAERDLIRVRVALAAGLASDRIDEFASRLRGDTEDELKADAEQLVKFFAPAPAAPPRRGDPSQGSGSDTAPATNPIQAALEDKLSLR